MDSLTLTLTFSSLLSYELNAVNEMLSSATCLRGLSLVHESNGDLHSYREALKLLLSSVRYRSRNVLTNVLDSKNY